MIRLACTVCSHAQPGFQDDLGVAQHCGQPMVRQPLPAASVTKEVIDTGRMARRIEIFADVTDLQRRRASDSVIK